MAKKTLSRRDFLKAAVAGTATLGLMGIGISASAGEMPEMPEGMAPPEGMEGGMPPTMGNAAPDVPIGGGEFTKITETIYSNANWRAKPEPIAESEITEVLEADVCVMGQGHAGATAAMQLSESGFSVIGLEKQAQDVFRTTGNDMGHINSKLSESLGGGSGYDPVE